MIQSPRPFTPFHFGPTENRLFGCHHPPQSEPIQEDAIVLCAPMGHEYIRSHRALRQLAVRLTDAGFHVLRFDFFGCGDSRGDEEQGRISQWLKDISLAIETLRKRSAVHNISLAGLRLGATLAAVAAAHRGDVQRLILWEPVVHGVAYLQRLTDEHRQKLQHLSDHRRRESRRKSPAETFGFRCGKPLREELTNVDLLRVRNKPAQSALLVENERQRCLRKLKRHLATLDTSLDHQFVRDHNIWSAESNRVLVPRRTIECIVEWLAKDDL